MFLRDLFASMKRRWYFVLAGIFLTAGMAFGVYRMVPVTYEATASVAMIPPPTAVISGDNPFLYMGGLEQALGVLTVKVNSDSIREPIKSVDPSTVYSAVRDTSTSGPIMKISAEGPTPESALSTLHRVVSAMPRALSSLQDDLSLSETARITLLDLSSDREATVADEGRTRIVLMALALGSAATLLITGLADKLLVRRRAARRGVKNGYRPARVSASPIHRKEEVPVQVEERAWEDTLRVSIGNHRS